MAVVAKATAPETLAPATALAVVAKVARPALATFKLATCVVDVTTNGAVPIAMLDMSCVPEMLPVAITLPVPKLLTFALPVAFNVPAMFTPVPVITATLLVPPTLILTLPLLTGILTLLVPLLILLLLIPAMLLSPPPSPVITPANTTLPDLLILNLLTAFVVALNNKLFASLVTSVAPTTNVVNCTLLLFHV